jgi:hypothetical protein
MDTYTEAYLLDRPRLSPDKTSYSEVSMRSFSLTAGALSVLIACATFSVAQAQDDKSYLPPSSYQGKAEPSQTRDMRSQGRRYAIAQPRQAAAPHYRAAAAQPQRHRVATYRRHHRERYAYNTPSFFRVLLPFSWFR